jgi:hypothetical protein
MVVAPQMAAHARAKRMRQPVALGQPDAPRLAPFGVWIPLPAFARVDAGSS